jgi:cell fate (sporulation/competence/biofilm development) regulator YlbF (YheA/YmcA/DUF963 family)
VKLKKILELRKMRARAKEVEQKDNVKEVLEKIKEVLKNLTDNLIEPLEEPLKVNNEKNKI